MSFSNLGVFVRGALMGMVEIVPGISGGTIALVTGIYTRLVESLKVLDVASLRHLNKDELFKALRFLIPLGLGMILGALLSISLVLHFVESQPTLFWGVIFGVVAGALFDLLRDQDKRALFVYSPIGLILGLLLLLIPSQQLVPPLWLFLVGGFGAFAAWLLPGISGSTVLLLLGIWLPILDAIRTFNLTHIALFLAGVILAFSVLPRFVHALLGRYRLQVIAFFVGLVSSSLLQAWPWKSAYGVWSLPVSSPGEPPIWMVCLACAVGLGVILLILRFLKRYA